ncbi:PadR family transcriptional regulator [Actinocrispum sp. NPDC049592]|uniref:PadR family transcriptional regulator n=1 Tax=Actinocrispum sp. NPDC049592 TaxID=3154835 RepID=UPI0034131BAC
MYDQRWGREGRRERRGPFPGGFDEWSGGRGMGRGRGGRGHRGRRGDVRAAILALLAERPMHGYEIIQEISERSGGLWRPSPGSVYPTLQLLSDEGLVASTGSGAGSRRAFELTEEGRAEAAKQETPPWEEVAGQVDPQDVELRTAMAQLASAVVQVAQAATPAQKTKSVDTLNETRRAIYAILGSTDDE